MGTTQVINDIEQLKDKIYKHGGIQHLKLFGNNFKAKPLDAEEIKIFMASLWAFYKETPAGILALSLRINDFWDNVNPWESTAKAAHLLCADVDEFGLQQYSQKFFPTHHQLFRETAEFLNVSTKDLASYSYILEAGTAIGQASYEYYRNKPIACGLGFHLASELTSWLEFQEFLAGFVTHKDLYGVKDENDPALLFFMIHTKVEPLHLANSEKIIESYLEIKPEEFNNIVEGAEAYMSCYSDLFEALNKRIYL